MKKRWKFKSTIINPNFTVFLMFFLIPYISHVSHCTMNGINEKEFKINILSYNIELYLLNFYAEIKMTK